MGREMWGRAREGPMKMKPCHHGLTLVVICLGAFEMLAPFVCPLAEDLHNIALFL